MPRTVVVEDAVYDKLSELAKADRRTLKGYVAIVLERHCAGHAEESKGERRVAAVNPGTPWCRCGHSRTLHQKFSADGKCEHCLAACGRFQEAS